VTAFIEADLLPFSYFVDEVSLTVTFSPAAVTRVKPELVTLLTLPIDPPAAGPERALEPPPAAARPAKPVGAVLGAAVVVGVGVGVVPALDIPPYAESPITGTKTAAVSQRPFLLEVSRWTREKPA
jgi:hypothetical protein